MLLIDKYAYFNDLKHIHPLEKMTLAFSLLFFSLAIKDTSVSIATFVVMSMLIILGAKIPVGYYIKLLLLPVFFLLSGIGTILVSFAGIETIIPPPLWSLPFGSWRIYITTDNMTTACQLFYVALSSISCLYFLILTTPVHDIFQIFRKLKMPLLLIEIMELTYRFIFVFLETTIKIYQAQNSRLGYRTGKQCLYSISLLVSALFMAVFKRSKELTLSLDSRAYSNELSYVDENHQFSAVNWLIIFTILAIIIMIYMLTGGISNG